MTEHVRIRKGKSKSVIMTTVSFTGASFHFITLTIANHFPLDYGGFILIPIPIFQLRGLSTQRTTVLLLETEAKKYLSLFVILCHYISPASNKERRFSLALLPLLMNLQKHFLLSFTAEPD